MIIGITKSEDNKETRTPITPTTIQNLIQLGHTFLIQKDIGKKSYFSNLDYKTAGAKITNAHQIYKTSNIIITFAPPPITILKQLSPNQILISNFNNNSSLLPKTQATIIQLEKTPRTSYYQNIDTLTSQALPRGYCAALFALLKSPQIAPLLFTPSVSLHKSKALVIGASITGLESASLLKKNGADTFILDKLNSSQELASSVGANFIHSTPHLDLSFHLKDKDIIITSVTSLPKNSSPIITPKHLLSLKKGAIIIDTTPNNISIPKDHYQKSTYTFYRNPYFERLSPQTSSILFSSNIENLIKLLLPYPDSNPDFSHLKPMLSPQKKE